MCRHCCCGCYYWCRCCEVGTVVLVVDAMCAAGLRGLLKVPCCDDVQEMGDVDGHMNEMIKPTFWRLGKLPGRSVPASAPRVLGHPYLPVVGAGGTVSAAQRIMTTACEHQSCY